MCIRDRFIMSIRGFLESTLKYRYKEVFFRFFLHSACELTALCFALVLLLSIIIWRLSKKRLHDSAHYPKDEPEGLEMTSVDANPEAESTSIVLHHSARRVPISTDKDDSKSVKSIIIFLLRHLMSYIFIVMSLSASLIPTVYNAFDYITTTKAMSLSCFILLVLEVIRINCIIFRPRPEETQKVYFGSEGKRRCKRILLAAFWCFLAFYAFVTNYVSGGLCIAAYHDTVGINVDTLMLSTRFTRKFYLDEVCPLEGGPCHLYATIPENASDSVFINVHTHKSVDQVIIRYAFKTQPDSENDVRHEVNATDFILQGFDPLGERRVFSALLTDLQPDTDYVIQVVYNQTVQREVYYHTFPTKDGEWTRPIRFISGGDIGTLKAAGDMTATAMKMKPDIAFVGGDIAYDQNFVECYFLWDMILSYFEKNYQDNYIIPLVMGMGNHDAGANIMNRINIKPTDSDLLVLSYFPSHFDTDSSGNPKKAVPPVYKRRSYTYHKLGNILFFKLDTGYLATYEKQRQFMIDVMSKNPGYTKMANYHNPIYPLCRVDGDEPGSFYKSLIYLSLIHI
eukprot:TRINITY_DN11320_c0_g2_i2.p1 TRINITY_DN11320_c0_g2~~TRINITY_DN11320_c0_g2_i2.p1  ORF type:complete len:567 (-),score=92.87 TRINITY_DN11320_c0_g2_i2:57-1757(-)